MQSSRACNAVTDYLIRSSPRTDGRCAGFKSGRATISGWAGPYDGRVIVGCPANARSYAKQSAEFGVVWLISYAVIFRDLGRERWC
jgi:hypothetical protein